jgi:hypothetical protein
VGLKALEELPEGSRIWVFGADRPLEGSQTARLLEEMRGFLEDWTAHRRELSAALGWLHHRFLVVGVDASGASASGCSVDGLMRQLQELEEDIGARLVDTAPVWFRDPREEGRIRTVSRDRFRELAEEGVLGPGTPVFDLSVQRVDEIREGRWERPAGESWHASLLPDTRPEGAAGPEV